MPTWVTTSAAATVAVTTTVDPRGRHGRDHGGDGRRGSAPSARVAVGRGRRSRGPGRAPQLSPEFSARR